MEIIEFTTRYMGSHCYLIIEDRHAIVIDPADPEMVSRAVEDQKLTLDLGILTHEHCDHCYGLSSIRDRYGIQFIASGKCDRNLRDPKRNYSRYFTTLAALHTGMETDKNAVIEPFEERADRIFDDQMILDWKEHTLLLKETPGHSEGSVCILLDDSCLFSGDTLFSEYQTNTRFIGGSRSAFDRVTMPWLRSLPGNIKVYAGHYSNFDLGSRLRAEDILTE